MRFLIQSKTVARIFLILLALLAFFWGKNIPWQIQISMYEELRQASILIFGLIGAWIAVLLPFSAEKGERLECFFNFSKRMFPALSMAIYTLIITLIVPILGKFIKYCFSFNDVVINVLRCLSFSLIIVVCYMLIWGLLLILSSFDSLKKDIEINESYKKAGERPRQKVKNYDSVN